MYKKIMVAVDGSDNSLRAVDEALEIARMNHAHVSFLSVIANIDNFNWEGVYLEIMKKSKEFYEKILSNAAQKCTEAGIENSTAIKAGYAPKTICEEAKQQGIDLIILGSRGLGSVERFILGSVSSYVSAHAHCSVMIVK